MATVALQLDSAVAAGYPRTVADCLVHEHHGAMGFHHVNRAYLAHDIEIEKPPTLVVSISGRKVYIPAPPEGTS